MSQILQAPQTRLTAVDLIRTAFRRQWIRYLAAGVGAAAIDMLIFYILADIVLPCVDETMSETSRSQRFMVDKTIAFLMANSASYWMNSRWVFQRGRHHQSMEIVLFVGVSMFSYLCGMQFAHFLIESFATHTHIAAFACIGLATVVNFAIRKRLIFRR